MECQCPYSMKLSVRAISNDQLNVMGQTDIQRGREREEGNASWRFRLQASAPQLAIIHSIFRLFPSIIDPLKFLRIRIWFSGFYLGLDLSFNLVLCLFDVDLSPLSPLLACQIAIFDSWIVQKFNFFLLLRLVGMLH